MLLPMLFCMIYMIFTAIGMVILAVRRIKKQRKAGNVFSKSQAAKKETSIPQCKAAFPVLSNMKIMEYQLIESQVHESLHFRKIKEKAQCRAGP